MAHHPFKPAFPVVPPIDPASGGGSPAYPAADGGLSVRDYTAIKAMHALITRLWQMDGRETPRDDIATEAYAMADAMLKARDQ